MTLSDIGSLSYKMPLGWTKCLSCIGTGILEMSHIRERPNHHDTSKSKFIAMNLENIPEVFTDDCPTCFGTGVERRVLQYVVQNYHDHVDRYDPTCNLCDWLAESWIAFPPRCTTCGKLIQPEPYGYDHDWMHHRSSSGGKLWGGKLWVCTLTESRCSTYANVNGEETVTDFSLLRWKAWSVREKLASPER